MVKLRHETVGEATALRLELMPRASGDFRGVTLVGVSPTCHQRDSSYLQVGFRVDPGESDHELPCLSDPVNILKLQESNRKKTDNNAGPLVIPTRSCWPQPPFPGQPGLLVSYNTHRALCRVRVYPQSSGNRSPLTCLCSPCCFTWEGWGLGCCPGKRHADLCL